MQNIFPKHVERLAALLKPPRGSKVYKCFPYGQKLSHRRYFFEKNSDTYFKIIGRLVGLLKPPTKPANGQDVCFQNCRKTCRVPNEFECSAAPLKLERSNYCRVARNLFFGLSARRVPDFVCVAAVLQPPPKGPELPKPPKADPMIAPTRVASTVFPSAFKSIPASSIAIRDAATAK